MGSRRQQLQQRSHGAIYRVRNSMRDNTTNKTLVPRISAGALSSLGSGLLAVAAVGLIALGIGLIYFPAGVIAAGLGLIALQWQFFG